MLNSISIHAWADDTGAHRPGSDPAPTPLAVVEVAGITVQAWQRVPSHFNMDGATNTAVSSP